MGLLHCLQFNKVLDDLFISPCASARHFTEQNLAFGLPIIGLPQRKQFTIT